MLDGKRYYRAFPDENPERPNPRALLDALEELQVQFRKHISQFRANQPERLVCRVGVSRQQGQAWEQRGACVIGMESASNPVLQCGRSLEVVDKLSAQLPAAEDRMRV
jgi:hypothetical protein